MYIIIDIINLWEDERRLYAGSMPFYIRDLSIRGIWYLGEGKKGAIGTNSPQIPTDDCIIIFSV